ncbi:MAG: ribosome maturation factor RimP [Candidatus Paracaedibacteraceae bacterium]|nr:ribosome maturation factor RimP [Candidatus Paracaedibacteraceae bacterium]
MELCQRIEALIAPVMENDGYAVVRLQLSGNIRKTLQIMIERLDDVNVGIEDCENVSRLVSPMLDVEDWISDAYTLEVSSPGLDRPLVKPKDFIRFVGKPVTLQTNFLINNRKKFQGTLEFASETAIRVLLDQQNNDKSTHIELNYTDIRSARLCTLL